MASMTFISGWVFFEKYSVLDVLTQKADIYNVLSISENVGSIPNKLTSCSRTGFKSINPYEFIKHFKLSLTSLLESSSSNLYNVSSIEYPSAKKVHIIAPAEAPEYSLTFSIVFSTLLRYPNMENIPMAPGPIIRYS